ncbi:unnamed protein product [Toxocara canis]|uniref:Expressed conserved protein n=1 Tax=Toxocara canis TaxID=6265 RepID=A0A183V2H0_TOXCA|nr:unnamed protein product [Toxocara canis]
MVRTFGWNPSVQSELDMAGKKESDCDKIEMLCIQNGTDNAKRTKQQQLNERTPNSASEQAENVMHADGSPTLSTDGGILAVLPQQPFIGAYSCPAQQIAVPLPNFTPLTHPMCGWQQQFMPPVPLPCQCRCQQILQKPYAQPPGAASNWLLRPVNIGGKVYYEPINIGCSGDIISQGMNFQTKHPDDPIPAPVNSFVLDETNLFQPATSAPSLPFSQYDAAISVSHFIPPRSASQTPPSNNVKKPASIRSLSEPRASIYTQHNKVQFFWQRLFLVCHAPDPLPPLNHLPPSLAQQVEAKTAHSTRLMSSKRASSTS